MFVNAILICYCIIFISFSLKFTWLFLFRRVMIILDITILMPGKDVGKKLGNPQTWTEESAASAPAQPAMQPVPKPAPAPVARPALNPDMNNSLLSTQMTHPIASLSPYQNK